MVVIQARYVGRELYLMSKNERIELGDYYFRPRYKDVFLNDGACEPKDLKVIASTVFIPNTIMLPKTLILKREQL